MVMDYYNLKPWVRILGRANEPEIEKNLGKNERAGWMSLVIWASGNSVIWTIQMTKVSLH